MLVQLHAVRAILFLETRKRREPRTDFPLESQKAVLASNFHMTMATIMTNKGRRGPLKQQKRANEMNGGRIIRNSARKGSNVRESHDFFSGNSKMARTAHNDRTNKP